MCVCILVFLAVPDPSPALPSMGGSGYIIQVRFSEHYALLPCVGGKGVGPPFPFFAFPCFLSKKKDFCRFFSSASCSQKTCSMV